MFCKIFVLLAIGLVSLHVEGKKVEYNGYKVFRITPQNEAQLEILHSLQDQGVSFWHGPSAQIGKFSDIMLAPHQQGQLLNGLSEVGFQVEEYISDVQRLVNAEKIGTLQNGAIDWTSYYSVSDIHSWLTEQAIIHSNISSTFVIGKSYEGRDLLAINISKSKNTKPAIFVDANIHAREWATSAVATYLINELLNGNDTEILSWTDDFDWYILPIFNPDGLEYSHQTERLWRKTRSNTTNPLCKGADANRNFDYFWFTGGSSSNPCSDTHAGSEAFSEPETKAMSDFINQIAHRMPLYLSLHTYGQYMLIPFGHSNEKIPQYETYLRIGKDAANATAQRYGTIYTPGNVVDLLYVASGETFDWVKGVHNVNLTYIYELRDKGNNGFLLPADQIIPTAEELLDGFKVLINEVRKGIPAVDPSPSPIVPQHKASYLPMRNIPPIPLKYTKNV